LVTSVISHGKILGKLGKGGMGVVFKAHGCRLDRNVDPKFLPTLTPNDADNACLSQEARPASALNHLNICTIHAIGEVSGLQFIDMEFVGGVTLIVRIGSLR
jgi:hypothetical protein